MKRYLALALGALLLAGAERRSPRSRRATSTGR